MSAHTKLTVADLSVDQRVCYDGIMSWLAAGATTKKTLTLGGYAGSGKSALISVLAHEMVKKGAIAFVAFTGKAASVLGRKLKVSGITTSSKIARGRSAGFEPRPYCGTIHGLIYAPCDQCMADYDHTHGSQCTEPAPDDFEPPVDDDGEPLPNNEPCFACNPPPRPAGPCGKCGGARFTKRSSLDRRYKLIIADEASMVSDEILADLLRYQIPILAVGDHGQLPPVKGTGSLMQSPDLRLEKIHRQAADNPIIALSARIRETGDIDMSCVDGDRVKVVPLRRLQEFIAARFTAARLAADPRTPEGIMGTAFVTATNKSRVGLNEQVRGALGTGGSPMRKGEVVICLKNEAPIYNGMRGVLTCDVTEDNGRKARGWKGDIDFVEDGQKAENVTMADAQFFAEKTIDYDAAREMGCSLSALGSLYDVGYALTCHKSQGSSFPEVAVVSGYIGWMNREDQIRWKYTSATRAADRLVWFR